MLEKEMERVDVVDSLMQDYRDGLTPDGDTLNKAIELGVDVQALKQVTEECYGYQPED